MTRYFFDIRDSDGIHPDPDGQVLDSPESALREAQKSMLEIVGPTPSPKDRDIVIYVRAGAVLLATVDAMRFVLFG